MYTDKSGHTRFKKKILPLETKTGLGSVGLFSSLFFNQILDDNSGDIKMQFAVTPVPIKSDGEGPKLAHTAPRRQLVLTLDGNLEFKSCDIDSLDQDHQTIITKGQILLADDLEGAGHVWSFLKDGNGKMSPWVRCYVHLGAEYDHFISKLQDKKNE
tara:strand:+ start:503 stop:973 length:471 start_codon:yes stop_codon:yes gene_type:complete